MNRTLRRTADRLRTRPEFEDLLGMYKRDVGHITASSRVALQSLVSLEESGRAAEELDTHHAHRVRVADAVSQHAQQLPAGVPPQVSKPNLPPPPTPQPPVIGGGMQQPGAPPVPSGTRRSRPAKFNLAVDDSDTETGGASSSRAVSAKWGPSGPPPGPPGPPDPHIAAQQAAMMLSHHANQVIRASEHQITASVAKATA
jgi:hypothetical protein